LLTAILLYIGCFDRRSMLNAADGTVIWKPKPTALLTPRRLYIKQGLHRDYARHFYALDAGPAISLDFPKNDTAPGSSETGLAKTGSA